MNEEDLRLQKIEKREKTDAILAYILIVFLIGAIAFMIYVKFIRKEDANIEPKEEEYTVNYITLDYVADNLKESELIKEYTEAGNEVNVVNASTGISLTYKEAESDEIKIDMPFNNNELEIEINENNKSIAESIYKEIAAIVCGYNNDINECRNYFSNVNTDENINGIRFVESDDNTLVYINILEKFEIEENNTVVE